MFSGKFSKFLVLAVIFSEVTWGQYTALTNVLVLRMQSMKTHSYCIGAWHLWYCLVQQGDILIGSLSYVFSVLLDLTVFLCFWFLSYELQSFSENQENKLKKKKVTLLSFYWWENWDLTVTYSKAITKLGLDCLLVYFTLFGSCCLLYCTHFMVTLS